MLCDGASFFTPPCIQSKPEWAQPCMCPYMGAQMAFTPTFILFTATATPPPHPPTLWQYNSDTRKQIIIKLTWWSGDSTKERHRHISDVTGHAAITVYRPTPAQLPPLQSSVIATLGITEAAPSALSPCFLKGEQKSYRTVPQQCDSWEGANIPQGRRCFTCTSSNTLRTVQ